MRKKNEELRFTTPEVAQIFDMPIGRLREWLNFGFIVPDIQQAKGTGTKNIFSYLCLFYIGCFKKLIEFGINRESASGYVKNIFPKEYLTWIIHTHHFILKSRFEKGRMRSASCEGTRSKEMLLDLRTGSTFHYSEIANAKTKLIVSEWDTIIIINLKKLVIEIAERVKEIKKEKSIN